MNRVLTMVDLSREWLPSRMTSLIPATPGGLTTGVSPKFTTTAASPGERLKTPVEVLKYFSIRASLSKS